MTIEKVANLVVIGVAVVVVGLNAYDRLVPRQDMHQVRAQALVGKTLPLPPAVNVGSQVTAVLFISKNCQFCAQSMPFYTQVSSLRTRQSGAFRLLAVTPSGRETTAEDEQYLAEHHVAVDGISQLQFNTLGIYGTPTLALLDGSGRVFKAWTGKLPSGTEGEIIKIIRRLCPECRGA